MIEFILFVLGGVEILCNTSGPLDIFEILRENLPKRLNFLLCEYCTSVWVGLLYAFIIGSGYYIYPLIAPGIIKVFNTIKDYFFEIKI